MLSYSFSDNKVSMYEQLYNFIKEDILSGTLKPDTRLPSKRSFAEQLSVSVITVENAYNQLMSEGFIYSLPKKGFYVSKIFELSDSDDFMNQLNNPVVTAPALGKNRLSSSTEQDTYYADFASNATDPATFPFATWAKLSRRILLDNQDYLMKNSPSNGIVELRNAISDYLLAFRGMKASPDNIIIGAGTETMYNILIQLLGHELIYASENPGYEKIANILTSNGVKNVRIPMDEDGIIISILEDENVNIIHTTPSHHFPTGITMPVKRRYELLGWANSLNNLSDSNESDTGHDKRGNLRYVIEDDYDSEFRLSGRPIPSLFSIDNSEKIIYMNTFTKSLASTIRISYMVLPSHLMEMYYKKLSFYSCTVSTFEQLTLAHFISEGYYEKHINRMRTTSRKKRDLLLSCIKESRLGAAATINEEESGLHFILNLKMKGSEKDFLEKLKKQGINISPVSKNSYMINYSSVPMDRIREAVRRINNVFYGLQEL